MKGVVITAANQAAIAQQYRVEPDDYNDLLPIGYVLIADFGGEWYEGVITQLTFDEFWDKGDALLNDYFVVTAK